MEYTREVFNRATGEMETVSEGDWITVTELGQLYGVGPRVTREILSALDVIGPERINGYERRRLTPWFIQAGFGKRNEQ